MLRHPDIEQKLDKLYAMLPALACRGRCAASCGAITMSATEEARIRALGEMPGWHPETHTCHQLDTAERCTVYAIRPMICRTWGLTREAPCPHGCVPSFWLTGDEAVDFVKHSFRLGGQPDPAVAAAVIAIARTAIKES